MTEGDLYLKNRVEGMTKDELILFVYQETVKILMNVEKCFDTKDIENRVIGINKAIEIISTLNSILNFEKSPEISAQLRSLYNYAVKHLTEANLKQRKENVSEISTIFKNLYSAWNEKMVNDKKNGVKSEYPDRRMEKGLEIYG